MRAWIDTLRRLTSPALLLLLSGGVFAQQAPHVCGTGPGPNEVMAGMQPAGAGIAPTPLCYWKSGAGPGAAASQTRWADRWGAFASDGVQIFGVVEGAVSKRAAERAAVKDCRRRGGGACEPRFAYRNQCAAIAASEHSTFSNGAPYSEEAEQSAMERCEVANGNGACWLYYSACSLPVQVR